MAPRKSGAVPKSNKSSAKKPAKRNTTPSPANKSSKASASNLLSLESINSLRLNAKQWLKYLQQADVFLDTLYSAGNNLQENGVLQKLVQQKGKNLSTGDFTSILMALMNTPLADRFFKGGEQSPAPQSSNPGPQGQAAPAESNPTGPLQAPVPQQTLPNGAGQHPGFQHPTPAQPGILHPSHRLPATPHYGGPPHGNFGQYPGTIPGYGQSAPYPGYNPGTYQTMSLNPYNSPFFYNGTWDPTSRKRH